MLKEKILELRNSGLSYNEIAEKLNCSKGSVAYHCNDTTKEKLYAKRYDTDQSHVLYKIKRKVENFSSKYKNSNINISNSSSLNRSITLKIQSFCIDRKKKAYQMLNFTTQDIIQKIESNPYCELSGRPLDINKTSSWHLDHKIPVSRGGNNSIENCQILSKQTNQAKSDMTNDEFLQLCKDILIHNGYIVSK